MSDSNIDLITLATLVSLEQSRKRGPADHLPAHVVLQIHESLQAGDKKADLAREFGVSKTTISRIAKRTGSRLELALEVLTTPRQIALEGDVKYNYQHLPEGVDLIVHATRPEGERSQSGRARPTDFTRSTQQPAIAAAEC